MKFGIIGFIFLSAVGALLWISIAQASIPALMVREVTAKAPVGEQCRVDNGRVVEVLQDANPLRFTIVDDKDPGTVLMVESNRHRPDALEADKGVGLRGVYDRSTGIFHAFDVSTKCPSKYEGDSADAGETASEIPLLEQAKPAPATPE